MLNVREDNVSLLKPLEQKIHNQRTMLQFHLVTNVSLHRGLKCGV